MRRLALCAVLAGTCAGCQFPADIDGTLDRVTGGTVRVGVLDAPPFVVLADEGEPAGVEVELVKRFADQLRARVKWVPGPEAELMSALHGRQLDIVIGGLTRQSPWATEVTLTRSYLNTQTVIAAPDEQTAEELSKDLEGHDIAVEAHSAAAAKLYEDTDAIVKADWMTASAAMAGVIGIGLGIWWADAVAAILIGADILHDGGKHTHAAMRDLLDSRPRRYDEGGEHPVNSDVRGALAQTAWVREAAVRMREAGHVFNVDILAVPVDEHDLLDRCADLQKRICAIDWKLQDVTVTPVRSLEGAPEDAMIRRGAHAQDGSSEPIQAA